MEMMNCQPEETEPEKICDFKISEEPKIFNDPIHGHIEIPPLLVRIIDTPEFQRMRNIKQLGGTYMVFPGASHNRFEHSLGVAYLAGELVKTLKNQKEPDLEISDRDVLCVQIAGLCHDLGHGPFSHLYDGTFMKKLQGSEWKHEDASVDMLKHLIKKNKLEPVLELNGLKNLEDDLEFIGSLIKGEPLENEKDFLYQIVANKDSGIDVDKWDYFARDSYYLGIGTSFDHQRLLKFVRVCEADGKQHICFREKEAGHLYNMFYTRYFLHWRAYQHPVCNIIEYMIAEAFVAADEHFEIQGSNNQTYKLSTAMKDMEAYAKLTDSVFEQILHSNDPQLNKAKEIIQKITRRELYPFIGETPPETPQSHNLTKKKLVNEINKRIKKCVIKDEDIIVDEVKVNYGKKNGENPLDYAYFYSKKDTNQANKLEKDMVSLLLPKTFEEEVFRVYCKNTANLKAVKKAWEDFKKATWPNQGSDERTPPRPSKRGSADTQMVEEPPNKSKKKLF